MKIYLHANYYYLLYNNKEGINLFFVISIL